MLCVAYLFTLHQVLVPAIHIHLTGKEGCCANRCGVSLLLRGEKECVSLQCRKKARKERENERVRVYLLMPFMRRSSLCPDSSFEYCEPHFILVALDRSSQDGMLHTLTKAQITAFYRLHVEQTL